MNHSLRTIRFTAVTTLLAGLLISGCTTHYRESLESYRAAEPSPFYQRTLEWTETEIGEPEPSEPVENGTDTLQPPTTTDRPTAVAARVLGITPETFTALAAPLEMKVDRDKALAGTLKLETLLMLVALENPGVEASRNAWQATVKQYSQADYLEGLLREYKTFTRYLDVGAGEAMQKDMNQAYFPYPSIISYRGEMIQKQVRLAELEWERTVRDALVEAGTTFYDYTFQFQGAATVHENISLLEDLIGVIQDRYATGLATQPDVLRLQAELERQRKLLLDFQARQRTMAGSLNALLGRREGAPLGRPAGGSLARDVETADALAETALTHRQEVLAQSLRVDRTEIAIRMGEIMNRPLFSQGYSTLDRGMMPDASTGSPGEPFGSRPDPARERPAYAQAEAYLAETRENLAAERAMLEDIQLQTRSMARTLVEQADIAARQTALIRDVVLPLIESTYEISLSSYKVGSMTFLDLLDAERKLISTRLELDESLRDQNQAILRISNVRGFLDNVQR